MLAPGTKIGSYKVEGHLGSGGMGEVYRGRDLRLGRAVAIKLLQPELSRDPELVLRFQREASAAGRLNHPNILVVHDVGIESGQPFEISELLEGETLAAALASGAIAPRAAIDYACQLARGLGVAHRAGIVHRDLKPANVFLTKQGHVKILDFGIAKFMEGADSSTTGVDVTRAGMVLGTAGYMAPEQLSGGVVDGRTDIFSLGVVFFEMLTGQKAFPMTDGPHAIFKVLHDHPPAASSVSPNVLPLVARIVERCLEKDPDRRFQSAEDLAFQLDSLRDSTPALPGAGPRQASWVASPLMRGVAVLSSLAVLIAIGVVVLTHPSSKGVQPPAARLGIQLASGVSLADDIGAHAVSPDGNKLAYVSTDSLGTRIRVRDLTTEEDLTVAGTQDARLPFWAPDGLRIGFFSGGQLKTTRIAGGRPVALAACPEPRGGAWNKRDEILFAPSWIGGLSLVSALGGVVRAVTVADSAAGEIGHRFPDFLPDGRHFLYLAFGGKDRESGGFSIWIGSLESQSRSKLLESGCAARFAPPDGICFLNQGAVVRQQLDLTRLKLRGQELRLTTFDGDVRFSGDPIVSPGGRGRVVVRAFYDVRTQLAWCRDDGTIGDTLALPTGRFAKFRLSPDGEHVAVEAFGTLGRRLCLMTYRLADRSVRVLPLSPSLDSYPTWSPDSKRLLSVTSVGSIKGFYTQPVTDTGAVHLLARSRDRLARAVDWSTDNQWMVWATETKAHQFNLQVQNIRNAEHRYQLLSNVTFDSRSRVSPDGRWIAYESDASGRSECYLQSFPESSAPIQVSLGGGSQPAWGRGGEELFYLDASGDVVSVAVGTEALPHIAPPQLRYRIHKSKANQFDVTPDGSRCLVLIPSLTSPQPRLIAIIP